MALSGTINGSVTLNSSAYNFYLTWEATQSVAGNYSDITLRAYWSRNAGYYNEFDTSGTRNASVTIGGNTFSWSQRFDLMPFTPNPYLIKEYTARINHEADGTKSVYIGARANGLAATYGPSNSSLSSGDCTAGATVTLDTIPRASAVSLNKSSLTAGESITANITPASGSFSHVVTWSCGSYSSSATLPAGTTSHTFTVPESWAGAFPNANSGTLTCSVQTKSGSTNIGSPVTKTATLNVPSYTPSVTLTESGNNLLDGEYVQGKSALSGAVDASSSYGATINSISTSVGGKTYTGSPFTSSVLASAGDIILTTTVTDSRGKTGTASKTINVQAYAVPYISALTAVRCTEDGTPDDNEGEYALVTFIGGCSPVNGKNAHVYKVNGVELENDAYTISRDDIILSGITKNDTHSITVSIQDSFITVSMSVTVPTVSVPMDFHSSGKGVAFGKVAEEEDRFDVAWPARFRAGVEIDSMAGEIKAFAGATAPAGTLLCDGAAVSRTTYARLFAAIGTTWGTGDGSTTFNLPNLGGRTLIGKNGTYVLGTTGGAATHTLTTSEIPNIPTNLFTSSSGGAGQGGGVAYSPNCSGPNYTTIGGGGQAHNNMQPYAAISYIIVY